MSIEPVIPPESTFDFLYGLELGEHSDDQIEGKVEVTDRVRQPMGLVHGGVYASMAEGLASVGSFFAVSPEGKVAVGINNTTSFLRPITSGTIHATARAKHKGKTTWVWEVECTDDQDRLCALSRVTVAIKDLPRP